MALSFSLSPRMPQQRGAGNAAADVKKYTHTAVDDGNGILWGERRGEIRRRAVAGLGLASGAH